MIVIVVVVKKLRAEPSDVAKCDLKCNMRGHEMEMVQNEKF